MVKFIKKNARRFISLFIAVIMVAGMVPASPYLRVQAAAKDEFTVEIDENIEGNIFVTLRNSEDPDDFARLAVKDGKATFHQFVDDQKKYDIRISGIWYYKDYEEKGVELSGTSLSFDKNDFEKVDNRGQKFEIDVSAGEGGTITSDYDLDWVGYDKTRNITIESEDGYQIQEFLLDGYPIPEAVGEKNYSYRFNGVYQEHTVDVKFFKARMEKVHYIFNEDGTVQDGELEKDTVSGKVTAVEGENPSFTAEAKPGYHISKVYIDGIKQTDGTFDNAQTMYSRTFTAIDEQHTVTVVFEKNQYKVTVKSEVVGGASGEVDGNKAPDEFSMTVFDGETLKYKLKPEEGCYVQVFVDEGAGEDSVLTELKECEYEYIVKSDCKIRIVFDEITELEEGKEEEYYNIVTTGLIGGGPSVEEEGSKSYKFYRLLNQTDVEESVTFQLKKGENPYSNIRVCGKKLSGNGSKIEINGDSIKFTESVLISSIVLFKKNGSGKGNGNWELDEVRLKNQIKIVIDKKDPVIENLTVKDEDFKDEGSEVGWTNGNCLIKGTVYDPNNSGPSSGISRIVCSSSEEVLSDQQVLEANPDVPGIECVKDVMEGDFDFELSTTNSKLLRVYAVDKANNVSDPETVQVNIDQTKPEITGIHFRKPQSNDTGIKFLPYGTFFNGDIEAIVTVEDAESGVGEITLYRGDKACGTPERIDDGKDKNKAVFKVTLCLNDFKEGTDTENTISVSAKDNVGNYLDEVERKKPTDIGILTNAESNIVHLKGEQPTVTITPVKGATYVDPDKNEWYAGDVGFNITVSTASAGLSSVEILVNGKQVRLDESFSESEPTLGRPYTVNMSSNLRDGANTVQVIAYNHYGNKNVPDDSEKTVYIDTTNPDITEFDIKKENDGLVEKIINFLTFGNFFNEEVVVTVVADDRPNASAGIKEITLYMKNEAGVIETLPPDKNSFEYIEEGEENVGAYKATFTLPNKVLSDGDVFHVKLSATATDNVGNITGKDAEHPDGVPKTPTSVKNNGLQSDELMIEKNSPKVESKPIAENPDYTAPDGKQWYGADTEFLITAKDKDAGIHDVQIQITDQDKMKKLQRDLNEKAIDEKFYERTTKTTSESFRIGTTQGQCQDDGLYEIRIDVNDNAGNNGVPEIIKVYKDAKDPYITGYQFVPATSDGIEGTQDFIDKLEYGYYFKTKFNAVIQVADDAPSSGLKEIEYRLVSYQNGKKIRESKGTQNISEGEAVISIPEGFKGQIFVKAYDNTKHVSKEVTTKAYVVDNMSPEIQVTNDTATTYKDGEGNKLYTTDMSFTAVVTDPASGIKEIGYSKSAELETLERQSVVLNDTGYQVGDEIGDGWTVTEMDENLVTKATKTFTLTADDNDVVLHFDAVDHAGNKKEEVQSEKITIDKTAPVIDVAFRSDEGKNQYYYNANRIADITVTERNFDADLIKAAIENTFGSVPGVSFTEVSNTEHVAVIDFDEGDYTFDVTGKDLGEHDAVVNYSGGNEKLFYVDKTLPAVEENFATFSMSETEDSFKEDKTVSITITEHNFDPGLIDLKVYRKESGLDHTGEGLEDVSTELFSTSQWESNEDVHTLSFVVDRDSVYQIQMVATDLAENNSDPRNTVVFEIDKTVPIVKAKNGNWVDEKNTEFLDVYPYARKDEALPTVEFEDLNIDHIEYTLTVYKPADASSNGVVAIQPYRAYLEEDKDQNGTIKGELFTLPEFAEDGVYALELVAVDVAGNKSTANINTYARMVEQDVLAYILDSDVTNKTGLYSFQYQNGDAISKRPDNFSDIEIQVFAKEDSNTEIVLRDNNAEEIHTNAPSTEDKSIYGVGVHNFTLTSEYFAENFQDDTDVELYLTAKNDDKRIDLGKMHIDNVVPECITPKELKSWHWYYGDGERKIALTNISEPIDAGICKVYDNGKEVEFEYSAEDNSVIFTIGEGWHNVGVVLKDMAGNTKNIQEISNIYVGFFWLWVIIASSVVVITVAGVVIILGVRRKHRLENE